MADQDKAPPPADRVAAIKAILAEEIDPRVYPGNGRTYLVGIPEAAARIAAGEAMAVEAMREACARAVEIEADACLADIVPGDEPGAKLAHARASALLTVVQDIRAIPIATGSQPDPSPASDPATRARLGETGGGR